MSNQAPSTRFSGSANPHAGPRGTDDVITLWVFRGLLFVACPVGCAVAMLAYSTFQLKRVHYQTLLLIACVYSAALTAAYALGYRPGPYLTLYVHLLAGNSDTLAANLLAQAPLSIAIGLFAGYALARIRWWRRPNWDHIVLRPSPLQWWRRRRNLTSLENGTAHVADGSIIGVDESSGALVAQTSDEARVHTLCLGASDSGKTTTVLAQFADRIEAGEAGLFVDGKGDPGLAVELARIAHANGRPFWHFSLFPSTQEYRGPADRPAFYDPLGRGDPTRRTDLLIGSREWSEAYYKDLNSTYLSLAFAVMEANPGPVGHSTLQDLINLTVPAKLQDRALRIPMNHPQRLALTDAVDRVVNGATSREHEGWRTMQHWLYGLMQSVAGHSLTTDPIGTHNIDFREACQRRGVICFSLDSSNYPELSATLAGLIIQDLKTFSSELREHPSGTTFNVVIDEFQVLHTDNLIGLVNKCRDVAMPITMITQAFGDLKQKSPVFVDQIIGIVNCLLIHRVNYPEDAELFAAASGTVKRFKRTLDIEHKTGFLGSGIGLGAATGGGRVEEVDEPRILANDILELPKGKVFYLAKATNRCFGPVTVIKRVYTDTSELPQVGTDNIATDPRPAPGPAQVAADTLPAVASAEDLVALSQAAAHAPEGWAGPPPAAMAAHVPDTAIPPPSAVNAQPTPPPKPDGPSPPPGPPALNTAPRQLPTARPVATSLPPPPPSGPRVPAWLQHDSDDATPVTPQP